MITGHITNPKRSSCVSENSCTGPFLCPISGGKSPGGIHLFPPMWELRLGSVVFKLLPMLSGRNVQCQCMYVCRCQCRSGDWVALSASFFPCSPAQMYSVSVCMYAGVNVGVETG